MQVIIIRQTLVSAKQILEKRGIAIKRIDFCDPQGGKGPCNRYAAAIKSNVHRYLNEKHNATTASEFVEACHSYKGIEDAITVVDNATMPIINVRSIAGQSPGEIYLRYQPNGRFLVSPQTNFLSLPGLNQAFYVAQNTLFKITFQGTLHNNGIGGLNNFIQVLVNNYLIIGTKVIPNTPSRINYDLGTSLDEVDEKSGYYWTASSSPTAVPISKVAQIFLSPGVYSFNVGARTSNGNGFVYGATVTYELTQFSSINQNTFGNFPLITTLSK